MECSNHGTSAGNGHYTADVLHPNGDGDTVEVWLHIDNEAVRLMRHEDFSESIVLSGRLSGVLIYLLLGTS